ncbi:MAG: sensor domain-containing diguanylate cyclase [Nitrospiraceae bacterium]|nr:sensor domain-containing diguanylate cyclase [Nitrospiraceae bacterium]
MHTSRYMNHLIDIQLLTKALKSLSGLTGLNFSLYDDRENLLVPASSDDALLSYVKMNKKGQELYNAFLSKYLKLTLKNTKSFLIQGLTMQYHVFMPVRYKDITLVALCEGFYMQEEDFSKFYNEKGDVFSVTNRSMEEWKSGLTFISSQSIEKYIRAVKPLLEDIISSGYEKGELSKRWQWSKTIISLAANIKSDASIEDIRQIIVDTVIFLFNVDTAAIFAPAKDDFFYPETVGGRARDAIKRLHLSKDNYLVSNAIQSKEPVSAIDSFKLKHSGFPEEIISMYLFPIQSQTGFFGFMGIFNSLLDREAFESVGELCKLSSYLFSVRQLGEEYAKCSDGLNLITGKAMQLYAHYRDRQSLCDQIVNEASLLVGAEKCSVMLLDEGGDYLRVVSVKGVNKWLMKEVKIKIGEGIAGKVYEQGVPVLIDSEEKLKSYAAISKPLFKTQSCISIPLKISGESMGILNLADKGNGQSFTENDLSVLAPFAMQAALMLKLAECHTLSEQMRELSITDPLTGLFNRRYFDVRLEEEHRRAIRYNLNFSLAILDIDDFKVLNDTEGHLAGDYALREIANIMANSIRANDILVRIGGEEFAIVMPQTIKDEAFHVVERIRNNISVMALPGVKDGPVTRLTISTGISMYPESGDSIESIIIQADKALYSAKTNGKNKTICWHPGVDPKNMKFSAGNSLRVRGIEINPDGKSANGGGPATLPSPGGHVKQEPDEPFKGFVI